MRTSLAASRAGDQSHLAGEFPHRILRPISEAVEEPVAQRLVTVASTVAKRRFGGAVAVEAPVPIAREIAAVVRVDPVWPIGVVVAAVTPSVAFVTTDRV